MAETQIVPLPIPPAFTRTGTPADTMAPSFRGRSGDVSRSIFELRDPAVLAGRPSPLNLSGKGMSAASSKAPAEDEDDDDDDDGTPRKPGTLGRDHVKLPDPTPHLKRRRTTLGPHLEPLREFEITDRTSIGIIGQADRLVAAKGAVPTGSTAASGIRARDVGLGLSLQFKLGH